MPRTRKLIILRESFDTICAFQYHEISKIIKKSMISFSNLLQNMCVFSMFYINLVTLYPTQCYGGNPRVLLTSTSPETRQRLSSLAPAVIGGMRGVYRLHPMGLWGHGIEIPMVLHEFLCNLSWKFQWALWCLFRKSTIKWWHPTLVVQSLNQSWNNLNTLEEASEILSSPEMFQHWNLGATRLPGYPLLPQP